MAARQQTMRHALQEGVKLKNYAIGPALNHGGFGIVYLARDCITNEKLVIKEYLPNEFALRDKDRVTVVTKTSSDIEYYEWGLDRFIKEAQLVLKYKNHPNIVTVIDLFKSNGTAYMVMEYAGNTDLSVYLKRRKILTNNQLESLVEPLFDALKVIHATGHVHRDIKPANILISHDGRPILLDFGSARQSLGKLTQDLTRVASKGYAPWEQYQESSRQGPWTDIYGLAATFYTCVTGGKPIDAIERKGGVRLSPASEVCQGKYSDKLLQMIDWGLMVETNDRPRSVDEWLGINVSWEGSKPSVLNIAGVAGSSKEKVFDVVVKNINPVWFDVSYWLGAFILVFQLEHSLLNSYDAKSIDPLWSSLYAPIILTALGLLYKTLSLYRAWLLVKTKDNTVEPSEKVGYLYIPVFSMYWSFNVYSKLANALNKTVASDRLVVKLVSYKWSLIVAVTNVVFHLSVAIYMSILLGWYEFYPYETIMFISWSWIVILVIQGIAFSLLLRQWGEIIKYWNYLNKNHLKAGE